ncbi:MAG TPA: crossover junction endodeoxyribonuclease RuvC, partial [Patescibacteria group bacterium]|nr:crossover junction endodeoxyribonuclease RuvC [Patescibacteria group bacterium]
MGLTAQQRIIVGFDPGLADTGFGVIKVQGDRLTCLAYGSLRTPAKVNLSKRLSLLYQKVQEVLEKYKPDLVGIEQLFFCRNV